MLQKDFMVFNSIIWEVLQKVIFPLKSILEEELKNVNSSSNIAIFILWKQEIAVSGFPLTEQCFEITPKTQINNNIIRLFDYIHDAKSVRYSINCESGELYSFQVCFEPDSYLIQKIGSSFLYGTWPKSDDWDKMKEAFRKEINKYKL